MWAAPKFSLTIIYESIEAGKRAKRLSDQLIAEAAAESTFELNLWNFGVLGIPEVRNAAASAAAIADIVILSMSGTVPLPKQTVAWVEMWTWLVDGRRPAVVALFAAQNSRCAAIQTYLRRCAFSKKLDFFPVLSAPESWCKRQTRPARGMLAPRLPLQLGLHNTSPSINGDGKPETKRKRTMKTTLGQLTLILAITAGLGLSAAVAAEESQAALKAQAKITQEDATKTALAKVPDGKIKSVEIEKENGKLIWSFDISMPKSASITEVQVNAKTGKIVSTQVETPKDQAAETAADKRAKQ